MPPVDPNPKVTLLCDYNLDGNTLNGAPIHLHGTTTIMYVPLDDAWEGGFPTTAFINRIDFFFDAIAHTITWQVRQIFTTPSFDAWTSGQVAWPYVTQPNFDTLATPIVAFTGTVIGSMRTYNGP